MAATAAAAARQLYTIAQRWNDITEEERRPLKSFVRNMVGYPCKLACEDGGEDNMEIYVLSERTGDIEDFLEIQSSGAVAPMYDQYDEDEDDKELKRKLTRLGGLCHAFNTSSGVSFVEHSDEEGDEEEGEGESGSDESDESESEETETPKEKKD